MGLGSYLKNLYYKNLIAAVLSRSAPALDQDELPCAVGKHRWVGKQMGGPPDMAESCEWVEYCDLCGVENAGSGEWPIVKRMKEV